MSSSSSSSRRNSKSQDPEPESPLSDRSPRAREPNSKKKSVALLSPKTPLPLPNSSEAPKHPRRYSAEKVTDFRLEEVHRPTDRVVHVDLEEIEGNRGGTPNSWLSLPANGKLLIDDSAISHYTPKTSTPNKSSRKSRPAPESLYKKTLKKSASRTAIPPAVHRDSSMDSYSTPQESVANVSSGSTTSPIRRKASSMRRALFSQQGPAPIARSSPTHSRRSSSPAPTMCQLVTPLAVHTSQEVNAVSATGQVLVISHTLVRSALASSNVHSLMNQLAELQPLISNEMSQVDMDHDNEHTKHEVFVGSDAILIQRISTIHRGRDRNSFETDDRRTYRFICQGDLLPEDRRDKQTKPRHLTIVAESATNKNCEEIEKSERVMLIFDAAEKPSRVPAPMPAETSLMQVNDLSSKPSALKDSPVAFAELVRVSDHSHINIVRKARVTSSPQLWDEPLTELKEQRIYKQQLAEATDCEPVRITRSHSMSRVPTREPSQSPSRRAQTPSRMERGRTPCKASRIGSVLRPLSPIVNERSRLPIDQLRPDCTPSIPTDLLTCISPMKDESARRGTPRRRSFNIDDTVNDSASLPSRTTDSERRTPEFRTARSVSRSPAKDLSDPTPRWVLNQPPRTPSKNTPMVKTENVQPVRSMRTPSPAALQRRPLTPLRTARVPHSPARAAVMVDEDTSAGSSQSPTQNRTPTTVSPRPTRLTTAVYRSPSAKRRRTTSRDALMDEWENMLDATQPLSPIPTAITRRMPDFPPVAPTASARSIRPLGPAKSCTNLDSAGRSRVQLQQQPAAAPRNPVRRAVSEHSVLQAAVQPTAITMAVPFRRQQYERQPAASAARATPVPRPRTVRPNAVAVSASGTATRLPARKQSPAKQKNVTVVQNPEDYDEGEIVKKRLTLDCKINGHLWTLSVTFALKADHVDQVRFAPKRVRIDDQTLWEETENWSDKSLTPVTGNHNELLMQPRTIARGSASYEQLLPSSAGSNASTQTPPSANQTMVRVAPKNIATASTASSGSRSKSADKSKKVASKRSSSNNSKRDGKKTQPSSN